MQKYEIIVNNEPIATTKSFAEALSLLTDRYPNQSHLFGLGIKIRPIQDKNKQN